MINESAEVFAMVLYEDVDQCLLARPNLWLCGEIIEYPSEKDEGRMSHKVEHGVMICPERHDEMVIDVPVSKMLWSCFTKGEEGGSGCLIGTRWKRQMKWILMQLMNAGASKW